MTPLSLVKSLLCTRLKHTSQPGSSFRHLENPKRRFLPRWLSCLARLPWCSVSLDTSSCVQFPLQSLLILLALFSFERFFFRVSFLALLIEHSLSDFKLQVLLSNRKCVVNLCHYSPRFDNCLILLGR